MITSTNSGMPAGGDTGAVLAAARQAELNLTMASAEASHLGAHLASRTPALPVRLSRTWLAAIRAARAEWARREMVPSRTRVPGGAVTA